MADFKLKYATAASFTITLASLATSSTRLVGRESTAIDNTSNLYLDALVSGKITTGTSPTVNTLIDIWVYGSSLETGPVYPDAITGSDAGVTLTDAPSRNAGLRLGASILVSATSDVDYHFAPFSVAALFGNVMPKKWGLFVTHNTGVNLNATGGNHALEYVGVHLQSV